MANREEELRVSVPLGGDAAALGEPQDPQLPRPRMPRSERAKIFIPFDPLKGYQEALRAKEREVEASHNELGGLEELP